MKGIVKHFFLTLAISTLAVGNAISVKADAETASSLINKAEAQKSFYYYNEAYSELMKMSDETEKNRLLDKLASIYNIVWNPDISSITSELETLVKTASGKIYDDIQITIEKSNILPIDKAYLLGEVTSWGRKLVWTEDYSEAMNSLIAAWTKTDEASVKKAEDSIRSIKNQYSRQYLLDELDKLKATKNISQNSLMVISSAKEFREMIEKALENFEDKLFLEVHGYNDADYKLDIINKIISENPTLDYGYSGVKLKSSWTGDGSTRKFELTFNYKNTKEEMSMMKVKAEQKSSEILKSIIKSEMKDYEKVQAIHDYIINNARYDKENYDSGIIPTESYTDYGILINGKAVCEGYAKAMFRLINSAGVKCLYVTGTAGGVGHAWNMVQLGENYYHVDATWDDPVTNTGEDVLRHDYFNVTDDVMLKDHLWDRSSYPVCNSTIYRYVSIQNID